MSPNTLSNPQQLSFLLNFKQPAKDGSIIERVCQEKFDVPPKKRLYSVLIRMLGASPQFYQGVREIVEDGVPWPYVTISIIPDPTALKSHAKNPFYFSSYSEFQTYNEYASGVFIEHLRRYA